MASLNLKNWLKKSFFTGILVFTKATSAFASSLGSNLPFASKMKVIADAISGPFLLSAAIIMIVITCFALAFGEWGEGFKRFINIVLWLSVAFGAVSFVGTMWGSGAVF